MRCFKRVHDLFVHVVLGFDNDRTKRDVVNVKDPPIEHGDAEKTGRSEGLAIGTDLFEVSSKRFLALVETADHLERRPGDLSAGDKRMSRDRVEQLVSQLPLKGQVIDARRSRPPKASTSSTSLDQTPGESW